MLYLIVNNKAMKITADDRRFDISGISQAGDYRYTKDLDCSCPGYEGFMERMDHWHFDGFYDMLRVCVVRFINGWQYKIVLDYESRNCLTDTNFDMR